MSAALLDAETNISATLTYPAISSGTNRVALVTVLMRNGAGNARSPSSVSLGGQAMSFVEGAEIGVEYNRVAASTWMLNEAGISAMSDSAVTMSGQAGSVRTVIAMSLADASQVPPENTHHLYTASGGGTLPLARVADSFTLFIAYANTVTSLTLTNPARVSFFDDASNGTRANVGYAADSERSVDSTYSSNGAQTSAHIINFPPADTGPQINPTGTHTYDQLSTYTTENFANPITSATIAGIACTDVSDTGATMPALVDETSVPMPGERELAVSDGEDTATANIVLSPPTGFNSVILGDDLNQTSTGTIFDFVPAAKEYDAIFSESPLVVDNKGNIVDAPAGVYDCWHLSVDDVDPNIAVARSFSVTLGGGPDPDDRPDDVRFNTVNNADLNTEYESNTVEITGINVTVDVTISGGEYRIDDGEWGSAAGTIQNGQEIQLRANSPADKNQTTVVTINVGSATFKWRIHTERDSGGVSQIPGMQVPTMRGLS